MKHDPTEDPQILGTIIKNVVTWGLYILHYPNQFHGYNDP